MAGSNPPTWAQMYGEQSDDDPRFAVLHVSWSVAPKAPLPPLSRDTAIAIVLSAMQGGDTNELKRAFAVVDADGGGAYRAILESALVSEVCSDVFRDAFHLNWTERGFRHRAEIQDDALLIRAFRQIFPPYQGEAMTLYRGERASEWEAGRVGLNWSPNRETGKMFASGLCTTYGGDGVLLIATAPPAAIIAPPNDHSANWLREHEHIVDPALLTEIREIDRFPPYADPEH